MPKRCGACYSWRLDPGKMGIRCLDCNARSWDGGTTWEVSLVPTRVRTVKEEEA